MRVMADARTFAELAGSYGPALDELALAMAAEFRPVDAPAARARLDALGEELAAALGGAGDAAGAVRAAAAVLGTAHGFRGGPGSDHPDASMLDLVLERRTGLPILLSVVYVEVGRRAALPLHGVGMPGHFVVAHFGADPPIVIDPHAGGRPLPRALEPSLVRPWSAHEIAMRMLNNLVHAYTRALDVAAAIHAARLRLLLPAARAHRTALTQELRALEARLN
jgi:regulator of sirC expression with transglutaminase-like and TPR domain